MQPETQCADHFEDRIEVRTAITGEGFVEAFPRQAGITRHLGHSLCTSNIAQSLGDESSVTFRVLKAGFEIGGPLLWGAKVFGNIVSSVAFPKSIMHSHTVSGLPV